MKRINISTKRYPNKFALVDVEDFEYLNQWKWSCHRDGYARRMSNGRNISMHRTIMNISIDVEVDHRNRNGLDNRRSNLRVCNKSLNAANRKIDIRNTSGYKGVCFSKEWKKWQSRIKVNQKPIFLGYFLTKEEAALAYNKAAKIYFGDFAHLNEL